MTTGRADASRVADRVERLAFVVVGLTSRMLGEADVSAHMTLPQWRVLVLAGEGPDGLTVGDIAARIGASAPSTSRLVRRLQRQGLVAPERDAADRRVTRIRTTQRGSDVRAALVTRRRQAIADALEALGEPLPSDLEDGLAVVVAALERFA